MKKITSVWIYYYTKNPPHKVRIVQGDAVTEFPCVNSGFDFIKKSMRQLFGRCEFTYVEILPSGWQDQRLQDD